MTIANHYKTLKIDSKSDLKTIKKAFRKEIAVYHPHNNKSPEAPKQFDLIVEAFDILSDKEKRNAYDVFLEKSENNKPIIISEERQEDYKDWQKEAKTKSKKYHSSTLEELLLLDVFLDVNLDGLFSGLGGLEDTLDGVFDLF